MRAFFAALSTPEEEAGRELVGRLADGVWSRYGTDEISPAVLAYWAEVCPSYPGWPVTPPTDTLGTFLTEWHRPFSSAGQADCPSSSRHDMARRLAGRPAAVRPLLRLCRASVGRRPATAAGRVAARLPASRGGLRHLRSRQGSARAHRPRSGRRGHRRRSLSGLLTSPCQGRWDGHRQGAGELPGGAAARRFGTASRGSNEVFQPARGEPRTASDPAPTICATAQPPEPSRRTSTSKSSKLSWVTPRALLPAIPTPVCLRGWPKMLLRRPPG